MLLPTLCGLAHPGDVGLGSLRPVPGRRSTCLRTAVAPAAALLGSTLLGAILRLTAAHWHSPLTRRMRTSNDIMRISDGGASTTRFGYVGGMARTGGAEPGDKVIIMGGGRLANPEWDCLVNVQRHVTAGAA